MFFYSDGMNQYQITYSNNTYPGSHMTYHPERWEQLPNGEWQHYPAWTEYHDDEGDWVKGYREWQGQWVQPEPAVPDAIGPAEAMKLLEQLAKGEWPFGDVCMPKKGEQLEFDFVRQMEI